jgi:hypothetical protein
MNAVSVALVIVCGRGTCCRDGRFACRQAVRAWCGLPLRSGTTSRCASRNCHDPSVR